MKKSTNTRTAWMGPALAAIALACVQPALAQIGTVSVSGGRLEGITTDGVTAFKGIPFAAPPVGDLRWRAPQPVKPWEGVRKADQFGAECMQGTFNRPGAPPGPVPSEDCLYMNVWTAAKSADEHLPVMVWIYGGSFMGGSGSQPAYDGTHFAQKGVVLVNLNYRLGVFGFLADHQLDAESPHHVSGNYGIEDMLAALKWVKANIAQFGGDPSRVTIFGESAGALSVGVLSVSPAAKGLFQRAISESGGAPLSPAAPEGVSYSVVATFPSLSSAEALGQGFLAKLGAQDITAARALPAAVLLKAQPGLSINPVHDGYILPADAYQRLRSGRVNDTPILVGTNSNEGAFRPFRAQFTGMTPEKFESRVHGAFGKYAGQILADYPHATPAEAEQAAEDLFFRDTALAWKTWAWARSQAQKGHDKVYLYYFDRRSPQEPLGPAHTAEIPFVFGSVGQGGARAFAPAGPPLASDVPLSQQMQSYWVNFARSGDPNGPGLPQWPAFSASSPQVMYLDADSHAGPVPNLSKLEVLDAYFHSLWEEDKKK